MDEKSDETKQIQFPILSGFGENAIINNNELLQLASEKGAEFSSQYNAAPVELEQLKSNLSDISSDEDSDHGFYYEKDQYLELEKHDSSSEEDKKVFYLSDAESETDNLKMLSDNFSEPSNVSMIPDKTKLNYFEPKFDLIEQLTWEKDICWGDSESDQENTNSESHHNPRRYSHARLEMIHQVPFVASHKSYFGEIQPDDFEDRKKSTTTATGISDAATEELLKCPLNHALLEGSWVHDIIWDPAKVNQIPVPPLILDCNDIHIPFGAKPTPRPKLDKLKTLENTSVKDTAPVSRRKQRRKGIDAIIKVLGGSDVSGNLEQFPTSRLGNRIAMPHLNHSYLASNHLLVRPDMSKTDLRNLHRPRKLMLGKAGVFRVVLPRKSKDQRNTSITFRGGQTINKLRKEKDISVADGSFVVMEYVEERPPILNNPGMATRLVNYFRQPADDNCAIPPKTYSGTTKILQPKDPSPFLGDIQPNVLQKAVCNNMFNAPAFEHSSRSTDFLLVRQPATRATKLRFNNDVYQMDSGQNVSYMVIREIPKMFIIGQTEPQVEVFDTGNQQSRKEYNKFFQSFMEYQLGKYFDGKDESHPVEFESVRMLFRHSNHSAETIKRKLKLLADNERNTNKWYRKPADQFPQLDELASKFRPEDVCAYESCLAGNRRVNDIGIKKLTNPQKVADALQWLQKRLKIKKQRHQNAKRRARALFNTQKTRSSNIKKVEEVLHKQVKELDHVIEVARYIRTELLLSPWYQTSSFVNVHLQGKESGKLRLTGVGDPSGCGEAFSFVREEKVAGKAEKANALKDNDSDEIVKQVTGTNADLRKLSMKESAKILQNLGMSESEIKGLKRWDRIYMIRYKCTSAVSAGGATSRDLQKFSRGGRMSHAAEMKLYRQRCNDIWARQEATLRSNQVEDFLDETVEEKILDKDKEETRSSDSDDKGDSDIDFDEDELFGDVEKKGENPIQEERHLKQFMQDLQDEKEAEHEARKEARSGDKERDTLHFLKGKRPQKAVKIVRREVDQKGVEKFSIQFKTDPREINIVRKASNLKIRQGLKPSALGDFQGPLATKSESERAKQAEALRRPDRGFGGGRGKKKKNTINLTQLKTKVEHAKKEKRDRKLLKDQEMIAEMNPHYKKRNAARNRRQGSRARMPHAKLNALLEKILSNLMIRSDSVPFHRPVNKREVPAYYNIIKNPIDLNTIKTKIHDFEYHNRKPFLDDLMLMANNAKTFNGEESTITKEGFAILQSAEDQLAELDKEVSALEQLTNDHFSSSRQPKKRSRAQLKDSVSADSSDGSGHARPVNLTAFRGSSPAPTSGTSEIGEVSSSSAAEEEHMETT